MYITNDQLVTARKRYKEFRDSDYPNLDRRLIKVIELFNELPGTVTMSATVPSWEGAGLKEYYDGTRSDKVTIVLAISTKEAQDRLFSIHEKVYKQILHSYLNRYTGQTSPHTVEITGLGDPGLEFYYNYWDKTEEGFESKLNHYLEILESAILSAKE